MPMNYLEGFLIILLAGTVLLFWWPGVVQTVKESEKAKKDWPAVIKPLILVAIFVTIMVVMASS